MIYRLVDDGELQALKIGRLLRIRPDEWERFLSRQEVARTH
jgi:excisionase family DNA binding protein